MTQGIEFPISVVFDDNGFTRAVTASTAAARRFDSTIDAATNRLAAMSQASARAAQAQGSAGANANIFLAALQKQAAALQAQGQAAGKSAGDLARLQAAELGVAQQAESIISAIEQQSRAIERRNAGARAVDNIRALAAERTAVQQSAAEDFKAVRAKGDLIAAIERETAALQSLAAAPRGGAAAAATRAPGTTALDERIAEASAADPRFAQQLQVPLSNRAAAQAAADNARFIASLERVSAAAGKTRAELLALEAAERGVAAQAAPLIQRIAAADRQFQSFSKTGRLTALELQQIGFQVNDFFVQLASGGNPLVALVQQGSQLSGTFGGIRNATSALLSLVTPLRVAFTGAAAGVGLLAAAYLQGEQQSVAFARAIQLTGNAAGQTEGRYREVARTVAQVTGQTVGNVREIQAALLATGEIGPGLFTQATRAAVGFADATGKTADEVAKAFSDLARSPTTFAREANRQLNLFTAAQIQSIKALEDNGRAAEAQGLIYDALSRRFSNVQENLGTLQQLLKIGATAWSSFWDSALAVGRRETPEQRLQSLQLQLAGLQPQPRRQAVDIGGGGAAFVAQSAGRRAAVAPERAEDLAGQVRTASRRVLREQENAFADADRAQVQKAGDAARQYGEKLLETAKDSNTLSRALGEMRRRFDDAAKAGVPFTEVQQKSIEGEIRRANRPAGAQGDPDAALRRQTQVSIENARRQSEATRAQVDADNEVLRGSYDAALIDLDTYYQRRLDLAAEAAQAESDRLETVTQALERQRTTARRPETREAAADELTNVAEQQRTAAARAERERERIFRDAANARLQLQRQINDQEIELAQLVGDEARAERLRNEQRLAEAVRVAAQRGTPEAASQVQSLTVALQRQSEFNQLQRTTATFTERLSIAEERYALAAEARGDSQQQVEEGLYALRQRSLAQFAELVRQAQTLAAASTDPRIASFAEQLALSYERAASEIEPNLRRLREVADELGESIAGAFGDAIVEGKGLRDLLASLQRDILRIVTREVITNPLGQALSGAIRGQLQPGGGNIVDQLIGAASRGFAASPSAGGAGGSFAAFDRAGAGIGSAEPSAARDALRQLEGAAGGAVQATQALAEGAAASSSVLSLLPQTAAIPATTGMAGVATAALPATAALGALTAAATAAAEALATVSASSGGRSIIAGLGGAGFGGSDGFGFPFADGGPVDLVAAAQASGLSTVLGYTGDGGKYEPKGIVHGGEHVMTKERVAEPGALRFLELMRKQGFETAISVTRVERFAEAALRNRMTLRGFAEGGYVGELPGYYDGGVVSRAPATAGMARADAPTINMPVTIINNSRTRVRTEQSGGNLRVLIDEVEGVLGERIDNGGGLLRNINGRNGGNAGAGLIR